MHRSNTGFTLLEVLVALVLLATALSVMVKTGSENAINTGQLRNKYFASIVAANKMAELRLADAWPATGRSNGNAELASQRWQWQLNVSNTPDAALRKVELSVSLDDDKEQTLHVLTSYLGQP